MNTDRGKVRGRSLSARVVLWVFRNSERREILGVPVTVPGGTHDNDEAFATITSAFDLLRDHGSRALDDSRRHTNGVFVWVTAGALGEWHRDTRFRRELAFARRLPEPGDLVGQAERQLQRAPDYFTSEARRQRAVVKLIELGVPKWLAQAVHWVARRRAA